MQKEAHLSEAKQKPLEMSDRAEGFIGRAQYNPDLFTTATITQTLEDFRPLCWKRSPDLKDNVCGHTGAGCASGAQRRTWGSTHGSSVEGTEINRPNPGTTHRRDATRKRRRD